MATRHTFGEAEDLSTSEERSWWTRSQPVVRRACDETAIEMIQGDLVGSRVFRGDDDEHDEFVWPVVQVWPGRSDRPGRVGEL